MKTLFFVILISLVAIIARSQPFINEINAFKKQDSAHFPAKHEILFVGSSSFTKWKDVQDYFPNYPIINRGFGGSTLPDVILYANDVIFPYDAKQIVIYCGENDLAYSDTITAQLVFDRVKTLFEIIRNKMPDENIVYFSIKPSPSRANLFPKMIEANALIKTFLASQKNASFVDVFHLMLNADGTPMKEIFGDDNLHMNAKGYHIWQKAIEPYLLK